MRPHSVDLAQAIRGSHRRAARVTVLDAELQPLAVLSGEDGYVISGSVSMDTARMTRRTCSITIANPDSLWTPTDQYGLIYWSKPIRIERGVYIGGSIEYISLGVFVIDRPSVSEGVLTIAGRDRFKLAEKSSFTQPYTMLSGQRIGELIRAVAIDAGMGPDFGLYSLDDGGKTLAADRTWETGEDRLGMMAELARDYSLSLRMDGDGRLELKPAVDDPLTLPAVFAFAPGEAAIMESLAQSWSDERYYNHVAVYGEAANIDSPAFGEAFDMNPASPGYIYGGMGDRLYTYSSGMIVSNVQAQAVAKSLLPKVALIEESIEMPSVVHPALEEGDVISVTVDEGGPTRYQIDRLQVPLGAGSMHVTARRLRSLT